MAAFPKHRSAVLSGTPEGPLRNGARSRREPGGALKGPGRDPGRTHDVKYLAISVAWMDRDGGPRRGPLVPARHGCELSHRDASRRPVERAGTSLATAPHRRCVGCESRAAEGRREDPTQGTERRGERFRNRNRRTAAAARERAGRDAAARKTVFANANAGESSGRAGTQPPDGTGPRRSPGTAQPARASKAKPARRVARSARARRTRRSRKRRAGAARGSGEPRGQAERGESAASGGARDTRPQGRDRAAGSAGQPGRAATRPYSSYGSARATGTWTASTAKGAG